MAGLVAAPVVEGALARAGLDAREIPDRTAVILRVLAAFERVTGHPPAWVWWVPGRIEIFGKHTDYAGGRSLVAAVPRGFAVAAAARPDDLIQVYDAKWNVSAAIPLSAPSQRFSGWANYVAVVARRLARDFPGAPLGADITFASDMPRAAGVSSSSALVVAVATALVRRAAIDRRPEWLAALAGPLDTAGYFGAVENGLTYGPFAGGDGVGTHGGSEDHTAILHARPGRVCAFRYAPGEAVGEAAMPGDWRFVIMASGVEASKAGAVRDHYNALSLAARELVRLWRVGRPGAPATLAAVLASSPSAVGDLRAIVRASAASASDAEALDRRLRHFVAEDGRVPDGLQAFARADAAQLGDLSASSQEDAEQLLRNQVPETTALATLAREAGAFAASSFGAGFGGSVWALTTAAGAPAFVKAWRARYLARHPGRAEAGGFIASPSPPVTEITIARM